MDGLLQLFARIRPGMQACLVALSLVIGVSTFAIPVDRIPIAASLLAGLCLLIWLLVIGSRCIGSSSEFENRLLLSFGGFNLICWLCFAISAGSALFAGVLAGSALVGGLGWRLVFTAAAARSSPAVEQVSQAALASLDRSVSPSPMPSVTESLTLFVDESRSEDDSHPQEAARLLVGQARSILQEDELSEIVDESMTEGDSVSHVMRFIREDLEIQEGHLRVEFEKGTKEYLFHLVFSPPFESVPHLEIEETTSGELELETVVVYRFGARIKARRPKPVEQFARFEVAYQAASLRRTA